MRILAGALGLTLIACSTVAPPNTDATAIRAARAEQNRAIAGRDAIHAAQFWTDDVTVRRGLGAAINGRDEYSALVSATGPASLLYERTPAAIEVSPQWPLAFETGTWSGRSGSNGPEVIRGRYSAQWVKRDGRWLIRSEVFVALTCSGMGCDAQAAR